MPNGTINSNGNFELSSLRGGLDDTSPVMEMAPDSCTTAENIEFVYSTLGERRKGCQGIDLPVTLTDPAIDAVTWMYRHIPANDEGAAELWALGQSLTIGTNALVYRDINNWNTVVPDDAIDSTGTNGHYLSAQTLHGKLFLAYKSAQDRLHVHDGTYLRRTGLAQPNAPLVTDTGVAGTYATARYFRVRFIMVDGDRTIRSEPSVTAPFAPLGTKDGAIITKPATISEHETHWEIEASTDDINYYVISTETVATTTYTDRTPFASGYSSQGELSEDIGDYSLIPSGKFLAADEDRLLIAGSWENDDEASRVRWTPVFADPGDGNDERLALDTDPFLDLDGYEGGEITGMSRSASGYIYVFKRRHIYKLVRANSRDKAYEAVPITKTRGALPGSIVEAVSQDGKPSIYFLDPSVGPNRLGSEGLQWCGRDLQALWQRVNVNALIPCHGVYYHNNRQLHYWLAIDGSDYPNFKIVLHVNESRDTDEGARRGWVTVSKGSRIAAAHCSVMFSDNIDDSGDDRSFSLVPFIGKQTWSVDGNTIQDIIQRCDTGGTDAFTTGDTQASYRAIVTSRPFFLSGMLNQHEIKQGALLTRSSTEPDGLLFVELLADFGKTSRLVDTEFYTDGDETHVISQLNDLGLSEIYALQISLGDLDDSVTPPDAWFAEMLELKVTEGNKA